MRRVRILSIAAAALLANLHATAQQPSDVPQITRATGRTSAPKPEPSGGVTRVLPGSRSDAFTTIRGNALTSTDGSLADGVVRLRDARYGRIVGRTITDKSGLFAFPSVDPGSYVVEIVGPDQTVLAASEVINVNAGDAASTTVKLPIRVPPFAGALGHSTSSAIIVTTTAAAAGVLATEIAGEQKSPRR